MRAGAELQLPSKWLVGLCPGDSVCPGNSVCPGDSMSTGDSVCPGIPVELNADL